jgi:hypothetical protein
MSENEVIQKIGYFLRNVANEHNKEYVHGYQMHHNTIMQKLIPTSIIETDLEISEDNYFKSLLFLDYMTNIISADNKIMENLSKIQKYIPRTDKMPITLDLIVLETGLHMKEDEHLLDKEAVSKIQERYTKRNQKPNASLSDKKPDQYYQGVAKMICDIVSDENKQELLRVEGKNDLRALIFTDSILSYLKGSESRTKGIKSLKTDFLTSSITTLQELGKEVSVKELEKYLGVKDG